MGLLRAWDDVDYRGKGMETGRSINDLTSVGKDISPFSNWNDEICSWEVISGRWRFYENVNYGGLATKEYSGGDKVRSCPDAGFPNNWISSIQFLGD
jgi:hypothetical protein